MCYKCPMHVSWFHTSHFCYKGKQKLWYVTARLCEAEKRKVIEIRQEWWIILSPNHPQAQERPTFVLADFLDPGERVYLHQRVRDADDMHHVHDTLKPTMNTRGKKRGWDTRGGAHCFDTGKTSQGSAGRKINMSTSKKYWGWLTWEEL